MISSSLWYAVSDLYIVYLETIPAKDLALSFHFSEKNDEWNDVATKYPYLIVLEHLQEKYMFLCAH